MTPEYLEELAQRADPDNLWRQRGLDILEMEPEKRKQMDTAVALRRYAAHIGRLDELRKQGKSLLLTPLSLGGMAMAIKELTTPPDHARLRRDAPGVAIPGEVREAAAGLGIPAEQLAADLAGVSTAAINDDTVTAAALRMIESDLRHLVEANPPGYREQLLARTLRNLQQLMSALGLARNVGGKLVLAAPGAQAYLNGKKVMRWINPPGKRNEALDCANYAYAAACYLTDTAYDMPTGMLLHEAGRQFAMTEIVRDGLQQSLHERGGWFLLLVWAERTCGVAVGADRPTLEQVLNCADAYGDARIMASRGRVDRSEVDEARKELRDLLARALGVDLPAGGQR